MLKLKNISKSYGKKKVLDQINLNFEDRAGVYGLLGRNGVGKTTLMKMMMNMIPSYSGRIELDGENVKNNTRALSQLVYTGSSAYDYNHIYQGKIKDLMSYYQLLYPQFDSQLAEDLLADFQIDSAGKLNKLSTGNHTLVQNSLALASRAAITLLDEPAQGLDSVNRKKFFDYMMADYADYSRQFILSTHLIGEIENYLTHVVILKDQSVFLDEDIQTVQSRAYRLTNVDLENKNIIHSKTLGAFRQDDIYDELTDEDWSAIHRQGGQVDHLDLQTLFNDWMEG